MNARQQMQQQRVIDALFYLNLFEDFDREFRSAQSMQQAQSAIDRVKEKAKQIGKDLARKYHPDLGGDIEKMKEVNNAISEIKNIKLFRLPPPQPIMNRTVVIHVNFSNNDIYTSTTATSSGTGSTTWPF